MGVAEVGVQLTERLRLTPSRRVRFGVVEDVLTVVVVKSQRIDVLEHSEHRGDGRGAGEGGDWIGTVVVDRECGEPAPTCPGFAGPSLFNDLVGTIVVGDD